MVTQRACVCCHFDDLILGFGMSKSYHNCAKKYKSCLVFLQTFCSSICDAHFLQIDKYISGGQDFQNVA